MRASRSPAVTRSAVAAAPRSRSDSLLGQQQAQRGGAHRCRQHHLDQRLAQVGQFLTLGGIGVADVDLVAAVRRPPARPYSGAAIPAAAVGGHLTILDGGPQLRRHGGIAGRQRRLGSAGLVNGYISAAACTCATAAARARESRSSAVSLYTTTPTAAATLAASSANASARRHRSELIV